MSKHTPGQWLAKQEYANSWRIEANQGGAKVPLSIAIVTTTQLEVGRDQGNTEANAHLIAAAPEFYEAAKMLEDLMTNFQEDFKIQAKDLGATMIAGSMIEKFKAAIAKAEGRTK